jgi:hypothetical protein
MNYPAPKTVRQFRRFLGLASWYRRFVPNFSKAVEPLTALLKKCKTFVWASEQEVSFTAVKELLVSAPILACPDFSRPFVLQTDASSQDVGAILSQEFEEGERPVAYGSRTLTKCEKAYSTTEQECLAVLWAVEKVRPYLEGSEFVVVTDHHSLVWLNNLKDPQGRLARWALKMQQYRFIIRHRPRKDHSASDALSRL